MLWEAKVKINFKPSGRWLLGPAGISAENCPLCKLSLPVCPRKLKLTLQHSPRQSPESPVPAEALFSCVYWLCF